MDISFALRMLFRNPVFGGIAILTLALGIGANTAIFSIVNGILLRPLPYEHPDRLVVIQENIPSLNRVAPVLPVSANHFMEWRKSCASCEALALLGPASFNLTGDGTPERINGARVSANYFPFLGIRLQLGSGFTEDQDHPGNDKVVVMSDALWRRRFQMDASIVGKTIRLDGAPYTVAGVLPPDFVPPKGYELNPIIGFNQRTDLWKPVALLPEETRNPFGNFNFAAVARLRPGVTVKQAADDLNAIQARIAASITDEKIRTEMRTIVEPMQAEIVGKERRPLILLMACVGAVLLIVCANLANLSLARATGRRKELAVRAALGASESRLLRQMVVENLLISLIGAALGLMIAIGVLRILVLNAPGDLPRIEAVHIDVRALLFTLAVAAIASLIFGFVPALRASRSDPQNGLRGGRGQTDGPGGHQLRSLLVMSEVAISVTLLIAAGLLLTSFVRVMSVDKGFDESGLLAVDITLPSANYQQVQQRAAFTADTLARLRALPGVVAAGLTNVLPLSGHGEVNPLIPEGMNPGVAEMPVSNYRYVNPEYFHTMGIPLQQGRTFEETDRKRKVAVVSVRTAARLWPGENAVGKRFAYDNPKSSFYEIIGIVGDVHIMSLQESDASQTMMAYLPYWDRSSRAASLVIRSAIPPETLAPTVRAAIWQVDPDLPVPEFRTMRQVVESTVAAQRFQLTLVLTFAIAAIVLAATGIYGVVSYSVAQRKNEIGIRIAMGARASEIMALVFREGMGPVAIGLVGGIGGALAMGRLLSGMLFGISSADPRVYLTVAVIVVLSGVLACYLPARGAMKLDPAIVLRD